jgi:hypothetical protein
MSRPYIALWSQPQVEVERRLRTASSTLDHTASDQFRSHGVQPGDRVYVVAMREGQLLLIGRIAVERVVDQDEAERHFGRPVYEARDHLIGHGTPVRLDRVVPESIARGIERESGKRLKIDPTRYAVDVLSLRTTGRITSASAELLDSVLDEDGVIELDESVIEGSPRGGWHTVVERSSVVRARAIQIHGTRCGACNFSFEEAYGPLGDGFIEVHHLVPLAEPGGPVAVSPATDVAGLCANCHRMVHRESPPLSPNALKAVVQATVAGRA